jgi:uncharacterized protein YggE
MYLRRLVLLLPLLAVPAWAAAEATPPMLTVSGRGAAQAAPDQAVVRFAVLAQEKEAARAQGRVNKVMAEATAAVKALGIPAGSLATRGIELQPLYYTPDTVDDRNPEPRIIGYQAGNTLEVRLDDPAQLGRVIDAAVHSGINQIDSVGFGLKDDQALRRKALTEAARDARAIAETLAKAMGLRLAAVEEVSESVDSVAPPMERNMAKAMMEEPGTPVQAGQVRVEANVVVRYRVGPE